MDRSLVQMERSRSDLFRRIGTMKKTTTPPHNGTVDPLRHGRLITASACGHGVRARKHARAVYVGLSLRAPRRGNPVAAPMDLVCTRRTMPAADVTRNRPSQRPFVDNAQHPRHKEFNDVSNEDTTDERPKAQPMAMAAAKKVAKKAAPKKKAPKKAAVKKAAVKKAAPKKAAAKMAMPKKKAAKKTAKTTAPKKKSAVKKAAPKKAAVKKAAPKKAAVKKAAVRKPRKAAMPPPMPAPVTNPTS
jgi:hypothetical protein